MRPLLRNIKDVMCFKTHSCPHSLTCNSTVSLPAPLWPLQAIVISSNITLNQNHVLIYIILNIRCTQLEGIPEYSRLLWNILRHPLLPTLREEEDGIMVSSSESSSESLSSSASCHSTLGPRWKRRRVPEYINNVTWWISRGVLMLIRQCWKTYAILLFRHQRSEFLYKCL